MDMKSIALLLVASSITSSVFATSIVNKLISEHRGTHTIVQTNQKTHQTNRPYTDFSGTWVVNCGNGEYITTVIENDDHYITLNGDEYRIGQGLQGMTVTNEEYARYEHISFEWNANGSALTMKGVNTFKNNTDNSAIQTEMDTFTLTMKNGQINLDGKSVMFEDIDSGEPTSIHCVLRKKQ